MTFLGDAQLVLVLPGPDAIQNGEGSGCALGPLLAQGAHVYFVGGVVGHDDGVYLAAVDTTRLVDEAYVEFDGLILLAVLLRRSEVLLAGEAVKCDHGKDHVDLIAHDPTCGRTGFCDRGVPEVAVRSERVGTRALR